MYSPRSPCAVCSIDGGSGSGSGSGSGVNPIDMMDMMDMTVQPPTSEQIQCITDQSQSRAAEIVNVCGNADFVDVSDTMQDIKQRVFYLGVM